MAASRGNFGSWFSWGANSYGQLAQGDKEDLLSPRRVPGPEFSGVVGGGGHSLLLTGLLTLLCDLSHKHGGSIYIFTELQIKCGRCLSCGWNSRGQLGWPGDDVCEPEPISDLTGVTQLAAGWDFSAALNVHGELFMWGSNTFGQLGLPHIQQHTSTPTKISLTEEQTVAQVACGMRHTLVLTDDGFVYASGVGRKGQLGVTVDDKPLKNSASFIQVPLPVSRRGRVSQVVCGAHHSAALTDCGEVIVWGDNKHGQLTLPDSPTVDSPSLIPLSVFGDSPVSRLYSGWTHMLATTESGVVYSWGRGDYGQLGRGGQQSDCTPRPLPPACHHPQQVVCGAEHNLLLTGEGEVLTWGWNEHGMCGTGDQQDVYTPCTLPLPHKATHLGGGAGHSFGAS